MQLRLFDLNPLERAQFATAARLLSCLVTESLVPAFYQPICSPETAGFAIILTGENSLEAKLNTDHILCIVPLHHPPIFKDEERGSVGKTIGLLDPLDMIPLAFVIGSNQRTVDVGSVVLGIDLELTVLQVDHLDLISVILKSIESTAGIQLDK